MGTYSGRERFWLSTMGVVSAVGLNSLFIYGAIRPSVLRGALTNPIALAFLAEAFLLVAALAYLLTKWRLSNVRWFSFVILSLLGGLAFALPVALLWRGWKRGIERTDSGLS